jgi:Peptidase family M23
MRLLALAVALALAPAVSRAADAGAAQPVAISFCPLERVRAYPLESRRHIESLVLQNALIVNRSAAPLRVTDVELAVSSAGRVTDIRHIAGPDLEHAAKGAAEMQSGGVMSAVPFVFCGGRAVPAGVTLAGPTLAPGQGMLIFQQLLSFQGEADTLTVTAHFDAGAQATEAHASESLPIVTGLSKTQFRFPLKGVWYIEVGATPHTGHRWSAMEEFAVDIGKLGGDGLDHRGAGDRFSDYYGYGAEVMAAADGRVIATVNDIAEDPSVMRRTGEDMTAYTRRMQGASAKILAGGAKALAGNYVVIDHADGEYSLYAHMQPGSVRVHPGDMVKAGQVIGRLGSSGNSTEPHLHFQVCDGPDPLDCAGIPIAFSDIELPLGDFPRPVQSGDLVVAPN